MLVLYLTINFVVSKVTFSRKYITVFLGPRSNH
jgi:hypothetical protein